jgi:cyclopropane-fatty-acyl-phospholipid synthase
MSLVMQAMEKGLLPDSAIRFGIRNLCKERLKSLNLGSLEAQQNLANSYIGLLKSSPLAVHTQAANDQHYELPPEFFLKVLGKNRKYSSAYWDENCKTLDQAEDKALEVTMTRAEIKDGMKILELGCGWGSLTLSMAKKFPNASIVALSNSAPQREWIEGHLKERGIKNVKILTRNIVEVADLSAEFGKFDRVVSVEMFEHLRNYETLFQKIASWLTDEGKLFVHVFTHKRFSYFFEVEGEDNWMGRYFFTGGQMPAHDLFAHFQKDLILEKQWAWDGTHYGKTSEAWLKLIDQHRSEILPIFEKTYGKENAKVWLQRWRVFFMSCAELFGFKNGSEWGVSHYLFSKRELKS